MRRWILKHYGIVICKHLGLLDKATKYQLEINEYGEPHIRYWYKGYQIKGALLTETEETGVLGRRAICNALELYLGKDLAYKIVFAEPLLIISSRLWHKFTYAQS